MIDSELIGDGFYTPGEAGNIQPGEQQIQVADLVRRLYSADPGMTLKKNTLMREDGSENGRTVDCGH